MKHILLVAALLGSFRLMAQIPPLLEEELNDVTDQYLLNKTTRGTSANVYYHDGDAYLDLCRGVSHGVNAITPDMVFSVGSTSKLLASVALLKLQELGMVDLDDSIGHYLPDLSPNIPNDIPIREILQHRSGLDEYVDGGSVTAMNNDYNHLWTSTELLQFIGPPVAPHGTTWAYCNTNYLLAGLLIEEITGENYIAAIRELVLLPAGIETMTIMGLEPDAGEFAHAWDHGYITPINGDISSLPRVSFGSVGWAAGAYMARPVDLVNLYRAVFGEPSLLSASSLQELQTVYPTGWGGQMNQYGLGIFVYESSTLDVAFHTGAWLNQAAVGFDLEYGNVAAVAINDTQGLSTSVDVRALMIQLLRRMRDATIHADVDELDPAVQLFHPSGEKRFACDVMQENIEVFNLLGQRVFTAENSSVIDLYNQPAGMYAIHSDVGIQKIILE